MLNKFLLTISFSFLFINLYPEECEHKNKLAQIFDSIFLGKDLAVAISRFQESVKELEEQHVEYVSTRSVYDLCIGDVQYKVTNHSYMGEGDTTKILDRYKTALWKLDQANVALAMRDGLILGVLIAMMNVFLQCDLKTCGMAFVLSPVLLTLARYAYIGKMPYLDLPKLDLKDNYFGILENSGLLYCGLGEVFGGILANAILAKCYHPWSNDKEDLKLRDFEFESYCNQEIQEKYTQRVSSAS